MSESREEEIISLSYEIASVILHEKYGAFEDYTFYTLYLKPNRELYNTIYRNGENIIMVSPSEIRMQMIDELSSVVQKLKTLDCE